MRICVVSFVAPVHGIGGLQDVMSDTAEELVRQGHDVEVLTSAHPEGRLTEERNGVRLHYIPEAPAVSGRPGRNPRWLDASARLFEEIAEVAPFDVVHSESTSARAIVPCCRLNGTPVVIRFHGNYLGFMRSTMKRVLRPRTSGECVREAKAALWATAETVADRHDIPAFRRCLTIVPSRQQVKDTRLSHLVPASSIRVVPNGVDEGRFRPRDREGARKSLGLGAEQKLVVAIGRLSADKGFDVAIDAIGALAETMSEPPLLLIVGDGPERGRLERDAADAKIERLIRFVGPQSPDTIPAWLNAADVFAFPTRRDEAAPLVLIQAMASGVPVVASASGSIPEVIDKPWQNGVVVRPGKPASLASALERLCSDETLARELGMAGRRRVLERYTVTAMVGGLLGVYEEAEHATRAMAFSAPPRAR